MNIVKTTNRIALFTVILLVYWVFIFVCITVFGFKVFRENMTEAFFLSIFGIFSILGGSIVLNIMYNLTAIAEGKEAASITGTYKTKNVIAIFCVSLIAIFAFLYIADEATSKKKEQYLVSAASDLISEQSEIIDSLSRYNFSKDYINNASKSIKVLSKVEEKFPRVTVIVRDQLNNKPLLLGFSSYSSLGEDSDAHKENYILSTSSEEREYLNLIFDNRSIDHKFSSHNGRYEIYYPVKTASGVIVLHLSQHSRYGKLGS